MASYLLLCGAVIVLICESFHENAAKENYDYNHYYQGTGIPVERPRRVYYYKPKCMRTLVKTYYTRPKVYFKPYYQTPAVRNLIFRKRCCKNNVFPTQSTEKPPTEPPESTVIPTTPDFYVYPNPKYIFEIDIQPPTTTVAEEIQQTTTPYPFYVPITSHNRPYQENDTTNNSLLHEGRSKFENINYQDVFDEKDPKKSSPNPIYKTLRQFNNSSAKNQRYGTPPIHTNFGSRIPSNLPVENALSQTNIDLDPRILSNFPSQNRLPSTRTNFYSRIPSNMPDEDRLSHTPTNVVTNLPVENGLTQKPMKFNSRIPSNLPVVNELPQRHTQFDSRIPSNLPVESHISRNFDSRISSYLQVESKLSPTTLYNDSGIPPNLPVENELPQRHMQFDSRIPSNLPVDSHTSTNFDPRVRVGNELSQTTLYNNSRIPSNLPVENELPQKHTQFDLGKLSNLPGESHTSTNFDPRIPSYLQVGNELSRTSLYNDSRISSNLPVENELPQRHPQFDSGTPLNLPGKLHTSANFAPRIPSNLPVANELSQRHSQFESRTPSYLPGESHTSTNFDSRIPSYLRVENELPQTTLYNDLRIPSNLPVVNGITQIPINFDSRTPSNPPVENEVSQTYTRIPLHPPVENGISHTRTKYKSDIPLHRRFNYTSSKQNFYKSPTGNVYFLKPGLRLTLKNVSLDVKQEINQNTKNLPLENINTSGNVIGHNNSLSGQELEITFDEGKFNIKE